MTWKREGKEEPVGQRKHKRKRTTADRKGRQEEGKGNQMKDGQTDYDKRDGEGLAQNGRDGREKGTEGNRKSKQKELKGGGRENR